MFSQRSEKCNDRQIRQITFLSQFLHSVEYVSGEASVAPDALSRLEISALQAGLPDLLGWAVNQAADAELQSILSDGRKTFLQLQAKDTPHGPVYSDISSGNSRWFVPQSLRRMVFATFHNQAHEGCGATLRLIAARYCWPGMNRQVRFWTRACEQC